MKLIKVKLGKKWLESVVKFTKDKASDEDTKYEALTTYVTDLYNISKAAAYRYIASPTVVSTLNYLNFS